jgi:hypothetical protein
MAGEAMRQESIRERRGRFIFKMLEIDRQIITDTHLGPALIMEETSCPGRDAR